ncbi:unnamed protein product [Camellia sinensis]
MEGCGLRSKLVNDDERRTLLGLLDAFGAVFSLKEIASAYCKACGGSICNSFTHVPNSLWKCEKKLRIILY